MMSKLPMNMIIFWKTNLYLTNKMGHPSSANLGKLQIMYISFLLPSLWKLNGMKHNKLCISDYVCPIEITVMHTINSCKHTITTREIDH